MAICKFFLQGNCKFGDHCRNEHPRGNHNNNNSNNHRNAFSALSNQREETFATPRRQGGRGGFNDLGSRISGFGGAGFGGGRGRGRDTDSFQSRQEPSSTVRGRGAFRGRGGFQGRGGGRRDDQIRPADAYDVNPQILQADLQTDRPLWVCSCYGPGRNPPTNLLGGPDLEVSPEELRVEHYLKMMQNQGEESANLERVLAEEMLHRVNTILGDPQGAMKYVADGKNEHPNRHDIAKQFNPSRNEMPWGQFSRDNQRNRRGVFKDQPRPRQNTSNGGGFSNSLSNTFGQGSGFSGGGVGSGTGAGFGGVFTTSSNTVTGPSNLFGGPSLSPSLSQVQEGHGIFARNDGVAASTGIFGQQAPNSGDTSMISPTQNTFPRPRQEASFGQIQQNNDFAQPRQPTSIFASQSQLQDGFSQPASQLLPNSFGQSTFDMQQPQSRNIFDNRLEPVSGMFGTANEDQMNGSLTQSQTPNSTMQQPLKGPRAELKGTYDYMNQNRNFQDGFMPETAPEQDWIS